MGAVSVGEQCAGVCILGPLLGVLGRSEVRSHSHWHSGPVLMSNGSASPFSPHVGTGTALISPGKGARATAGSH
jgi:hypothetical protein